MENPIPTKTDALIAALEEMYPLRCIRPGEAIDEAHRYAGARAVVEHLVRWREMSDE